MIYVYERPNTVWILLAIMRATVECNNVGEKQYFLRKYVR